MYNQAQVQNDFPNPFLEIFESINEVKDLLKTLTQKNANTDPEEDKILTIKEAAEYINLSVPSMYRLCSENKLPNFKKGKKIMFSKDELTAWIKEGRRKTVNEIKEDAETHLGNLGHKKAANSKAVSSS